MRRCAERPAPPPRRPRLLASAAPAQAAPRPLAYSQFGIGLRARRRPRDLHARRPASYAVPAAGGPARRVLSFRGRGRGAGDSPRLRARARDHARHRRARRAAPGLLGPARRPVDRGSMTPRDRSFRAPGRWRPAVHVRVREPRSTTSSVTVRDPDPRDRPLPGGPRCGRRRLRRRSRGLRDGRPIRRARLAHRGAARPSPSCPTSRPSIDLRDDGRALVATDDGELFDVPPGGVARRIARSAGKPRFAGEHIVFVRGPGPTASAPCASSIRAAACARSASPPTRLGGFITDGTRVLWEANGCLLVAPVTDPIAAAPGPGPCPRSELTAGRRPEPEPGPHHPVTLRCVAAPRDCRGTLPAQSRGRCSIAPRRFSIPAGRARRFARTAQRARISRAARRRGERDDGRAGDDPRADRRPPGPPQRHRTCLVEP